MDSPSPGPYLRLGTAADPAAADLCAALLRSAGIPSRLRGESLGPYRLTIGEMAQTEIWVPASQLEEARAIVDDPAALGGIEVTAEREAPDVTPESGSRWWPVVALGLLGLLAWRLLSRLL